MQYWLPHFNQNLFKFIRFIIINKNKNEIASNTEPCDTPLSIPPTSQVYSIYYSYAFFLFEQALKLELLKHNTPYTANKQFV